MDVVQEAGHALVEGLAGGFGGGAGFEAGEVGQVLGGAEAAEGRKDVVGEVVEEAEAGADDVAGVVAAFGEAGEVGVELGGDDAALDGAAEGGDDLEPFGDVEAGFVEAEAREVAEGEADGLVAGHGFEDGGLRQEVGLREDAEDQARQRGVVGVEPAVLPAAADIIGQRRNPGLGQARRGPVGGGGGTAEEQAQDLLLDVVALLGIAALELGVGVRDLAGLEVLEPAHQRRHRLVAVGRPRRRLLLDQHPADILLQLPRRRLAVLLQHQENLLQLGRRERLEQLLVDAAVALLRPRIPVDGEGVLLEHFVDFSGSHILVILIGFQAKDTTKKPAFKGVEGRFLKVVMGFGAGRFRGV